MHLSFAVGKRLLRLAAFAGAGMVVTACGGGGGGGSSAAPGNTVGGSIAGLLSSGLVLSDGTTTVTPAAGASTFTFANTFTAGSSYAVSIQTQPAGLNCTVGNGSGQIGSAAVTSVSVVCPTAWIWQSGADTAKAAGSYGTAGTAAAGNVPGARDGGATWTDAAGDLWVFGGFGYDSTQTQGYLNDLWKYSQGTGQWTWLSGSTDAGAVGSYGALGVPSAGSTPGARQGAVSWIDASGNFWLFGGYQQQTSAPAGFFNDLWKYSPGANQWTWVGGSSTVNSPGIFGTQGAGAAGNIPPARAGAVSWTDPAGNFWLFGGSIYNATGSPSGANDLWKYAPGAGTWTWVGGSSAANAAGVYGDIGAGAPANAPGARDGAVSWVDGSGTLWLFGGLGYDSTGKQAAALNDLWKFTPATGDWTWVSGSNANSASGVYGTLGTLAGNNVPGARNGAAAWVDASGNLWLFGGSGYDSLGNGGALDDVWKFTPVSAQWTWITGSSTQGTPGAYGTLGKTGAVTPGGRAGAMAWVDHQGKFWLFGGNGLDSLATLADLNDLWSFTP